MGVVRAKKAIVNAPFIPLNNIINIYFIAYPWRNNVIAVIPPNRRAAKTNRQTIFKGFLALKFKNIKKSMFTTNI
jgi:hypothetical protein